MATKWNSAEQKPPIPKVYERDYKYGVPAFCKFDGEHWYCSAGSIESARACFVISPSQSVRWREVSMQRGTL